MAIKSFFQKIIIFLLLLLPMIWSNTFALTSFKECSKASGLSKYPSKVLCDNNYYLYYGLESLHSAVLEIIKKYPNKVSTLKDSLTNVLSTLDQTDINKDVICKYFFTDGNCKSVTAETFIQKFNEKWILWKNIIKKNAIVHSDSDDKKIKVYWQVEQALQSYKKAVHEFTTTLWVILSKDWKFDFTNVVGWTTNLNLRLEALTDPSEITDPNPKIKHYKIGLIKIFKPFFNLSYDYFVAIPLTWRYIANPYIIFWIIWYYVMYISIALLIIFIIISAFTFPLIEKNVWWKMEMKRRNIWLLMMNSTEFNFINYAYRIFLTNENYSFKNDESKEEITIKNEYRVPFIAKAIIRNEHVWLWYIIIIWLIIYILIQMLSGYLI